MEKRKYHGRIVALAILIVIFAIAGNFFVKDQDFFRKKGSTESLLATVKGSFITRASDSGVNFDLEVANSNALARTGLMYRDSLAEDHGMLFVFPDETPRTFWMKNTRISLDIIFINRNLEIVSIAENAKIFSLDQIPSHKPAMYVVELNAGSAKKFGLKVGDKLQISGEIPHWQGE